MTDKLQRLGALVRLVRPLNVALLAAGVLVGGVLAGAAWPGPASLWLAALSAALVGAGGNAFNDLADLDVDRVNRPRRPLPSGRVSVRTARVAWAILSLAGLAVAALVSPWHAGVAGLVAALLVGYSVWWKRRPLLGNAVVGVLIAATLVYGGQAVGAAGAALVGALFAFLTTLAREIVKDVEDVAGDAAGGARTLPLVVGARRAARVAQVVIGATVLATPLPYLALRYEPLYLPVVLGAALLLLAALVHLQQGHPAAVRTASGMLKGAMAVGLGALAFGAPL